jgi:membrane associated rhomboid family serine protease
MGPQRMFGLTLWVRRLLVANLLVFLIQQTLLTDPKFLQAFGFVPEHALDRPWTFVTYMFLHAGILHLAFNMLMLFVFGPSVEERMGGRVFLLYYVLAGIGGAAFSFLLTQWVPVHLILGASGAIMAVTVAFAWYWPNHPVFVFPLPDPIPAKWLITFLVGLDLVLAFLGISDGVAHLAHLGGVGTGLLYLKGQDWRYSRAESRLRGSDAGEQNVLVTQLPRASRKGSTPPPARSKSRNDVESRTSAEIDRVLDKISAQGVDSLTPAERKFLSEMSRRMRTPPTSKS